MQRGSCRDHGGMATAEEGGRTVKVEDATPPAAPSAREASAAAADVREMAGEVDENLLELMKDPNFIRRGISALDKIMAHVTQKKMNAMNQIQADTEAIKWLDEEIGSYQPKLDKLKKDIVEKEKQRESTVKELDNCKVAINTMLLDASKVAKKVMQKDRSLSRSMASASLREARGFDTTTPNSFTSKKNGPSSGKK